MRTLSLQAAVRKDRSPVRDGGAAGSGLRTGVVHGSARRQGLSAIDRGKDAAPLKAGGTGDDSSEKESGCLKCWQK